MANLNLQAHKLTAREQLRKDSSAAVDLLMRFAAQHEHECNIVVAGGKPAWRIVMTRTFKQHGLLVNDDICDRVFAWMCHCVRTKEWARQSGLDAEPLAKVALDHTEQATPLTPLEVVDSLELDSASSDDGRRSLYGRDGSAERTFEQLKDEIREQIKRGGETPWRPDATRNVN